MTDQERSKIAKTEFRAAVVELATSFCDEKSLQDGKHYEIVLTTKDRLPTILRKAKWYSLEKMCDGDLTDLTLRDCYVPQDSYSDEHKDYDVYRSLVDDRCAICIQGIG